MEPTPEVIELLTRNACFAADTAAMEQQALGATKAQVTRRVVRRTIEFLVGNDLIEIKSTGVDLWLTIDPPYPNLSTDSDG